LESPPPLVVKVKSRSVSVAVVAHVIQHTAVEPEVRYVTARGHAADETGHTRPSQNAHAENAAVDRGAAVGHVRANNPPRTWPFFTHAASMP